MDTNLELEELILGTLSFYESMSFSKLVFDFDSEVLKNYPQFDKDQLILILKSLEKRGMVKSIQKSGETQWLRIHKLRPLWKRFFNF